MNDRRNSFFWKKFPLKRYACERDVSVFRRFSINLSCPIDKTLIGRRKGAADRSCLGSRTRSGTYEDLGIRERNFEMLYDGILVCEVDSSGSKAPFNPRMDRTSPNPKRNQIREMKKKNIPWYLLHRSRRSTWLSLSWEGLVGGRRNSRGPFAIRNCFGN